MVVPEENESEKKQAVSVLLYLKREAWNIKLMDSKVQLLKIAQHNFIRRKLRRMSKKKSERQEKDTESLNKVSYATLLHVLLQVTNYCILISMLHDQEGEESRMRREERRRETEDHQDKGQINRKTEGQYIKANINSTADDWCSCWV